MPEKKYELTVCEWEGKLHCVYLNDRRIAGGKPWGGGQNVARWLVTAEEILKAIPELRAATVVPLNPKGA